MQIDKTMLDRLLSLDDATLARTINALASAAGVDSYAANAAIGDLRMVRSTLANATNADISNAMQMLGEDRVKAIKSVLGNING